MDKYKSAPGEPSQNVEICQNVETRIFTKMMTRYIVHTLQVDQFSYFQTMNPSGV